MSVLRSLRKEAGLTQQFLAEAAGISQGFVSNVEKGRARLATTALVRVAEVLAPLLDRPIRDVAGQLVVGADVASLQASAKGSCTEPAEAA